MGLFDRLFRRRSRATPNPAATPAAARPPPPPNVKVFDAYGRPLQVPREVFRTKVLPSAFQRDWNSADALARTVISALNDGFLEETLAAARQLERIDTDRHRGATILASNLLRLGRFKEAEAILSIALKKSGPNGPVLANLALAQAALRNGRQAHKTLWQALQCDPNLQNALNWYANLGFSRGGETAGVAALETIAALPGSWLAPLRLAEIALKAGQNAKALDRYRDVLARFDPVPADALVKISGDLGTAGLVGDVIALVAPRYDPARHGLPTGGNLIHAYVVQKDGASARKILDQLHAQKRLDWRETLSTLERAIDQIDRGYGTIADPKSLEMSMLVFTKPLWLHDGDPFTRHFPKKSPDAVHVAFMTGSVKNPDTSTATAPVAKPVDPTGRFARALPIYLAEQLHLRSDARASLLVPWLRRGGLVLSAQPWSPELLAAMEPKPDYLVLLHIDGMDALNAKDTKGAMDGLNAKDALDTKGAKQTPMTTNPMTAKLTVVRTIDESQITSFEGSVRLDDDFAPVRELSELLIRELAAKAEISVTPPPSFLVPGSSTRLPAWCLALEQSLAVHCASQAPLNRPFLSGERNILDHLLDLTLREPTNVAARLLFLVTLERQSRLKAAIAAEYKGRVERLRKEWPLGAEGEEMAGEVVGRVVWE